MSILSRFFSAKFRVPELNLEAYTSDAAKEALRAVSTKDLLSIRDIIDSEVKRRIWSK